MLIEILAIAVSADQVVCEMRAEDAFDARRGPASLLAVCPEGEAEAQAAAEAALARLDLTLPRLPRNHEYEVANQITVRGDEDGWSAVPGQFALYVEPAFPTYVARRGGTHMLCAIGVAPNASGALEAPSIACISDIDTMERHLVSQAEDAVEGWRMVPSDVSYCLDQHIHVQAQIFNRGNSNATAKPDPMPDPARLPSMC